MGISNTLLPVATATGLAPALVLRLRAPASFVDVVKVFAAGAVSIGVRPEVGIIDVVPNS